MVISKTAEENIFQINRGLAPGEYELADVFADIRAYRILRDIFADADEFTEVMEQTRVFVVDSPYEIFVNNDDGSIYLSLTHLQQASDEFLYLDIIHELCHVKQHRQGRNLYDRSKSYVDRETEIEAYQLTVREARRIGLDDEAIADYLQVSWITAEEHQRLSRRLEVARDLPADDGQ